MPFGSAALLVLTLCSGAWAAPDAAALARGETPVRVFLLDASGEVSAANAGGVVVVGEDGVEIARPGATATVRCATERDLGVPGSVAGMPTLRVRALDGGPLTLTVRPAPGAKATHTSQQPGELRLTRTETGRIRVVCALPIDDYLLGVIGHEIGDGSPAAALEAQAIASRSYAIAGALRSASAAWDMTSDTRSQVYQGDADVPTAVRAAVEATRGQVLLCGGEVVRAVYHACCGGSTADSVDIWGGPLAGARPVVDGPLTPGDLASEPVLRSFLLDADPRLCCSTSRSEFRWRRRFTREDLTRALAGRGIGSVVDVRVAARARSGHVRTLEISGERKSITLAGDAIRWSLGGRGLPSTLFAVERAGGRPYSAYEFLGGGSGHGVGMCQVGAITMARAGADRIAILARYYGGATVVDLRGTP